VEVIDKHEYFQITGVFPSSEYNFINNNNQSNEYGYSYFNESNEAPEIVDIYNSPLWTSRQHVRVQLTSWKRILQEESFDDDEGSF
jgi:hypothetical protein